MSRTTTKLWTCARCLRARELDAKSTYIVRGSPATVFESLKTGRTGDSRRFSVTPAPRQDKPPAPSEPSRTEDGSQQEQEGAMSRRLAAMVEETMDTGSKSDRKLMQDVGFSEELKKQLEDRISQTAFARQNQQASSQVSMPVCIH